jgi:V8-like Glu-specific endopeptidase
VAPATAQPSDKAGTVAVHGAATTRAAHDKVVEYWTPQRMRNAVPADVLVADRDKSSAGGSVAAGRPTVVPQAKAQPTAVADFLGGYYSGGGEVRDTTGKVFFTLGGANYVCSGSAVSSGNEDVVLTAGHCVNEGPGAYATNWAFVPGYDDGARPYGTFTARQLTTTTQWASSGDFDYDVAFAVMNTLNGSHLTEVVGGQSIGFNQARGQYTYSFGYPAANPYDGSDIAWCHGTVVQDTYGGSSDQGLNCNMTGGSSGGPWFVNYNESTGVGTLSSVNSFKYRGGNLRSYMFGPYLGSVAQSLYTSASSL